MQRLALDHITAVDTSPIELVSAARQAACDAVCLFMEPMAVLPLMPSFDIYHDLGARRELKQAMDDLGLTLDVAYPFTLAGRTVVQDFRVAMECAAELGAFCLNALVYDRDPARRVETFGAFSELALGHGLRVAIEFYPPSQVPSLGAALALAETASRPGEVGVNADLLHLMRSGGTIAELAAAPREAIMYGQLADGLAEAPPDLDFEASSERLLPGEGRFDLPAFVAALPQDCRVSVEIPRNHAVRAGEPRAERVRRAVVGVRAALAG